MRLRYTNYKSNVLTSLVKIPRLNGGWSYGGRSLRLTPGGSIDGSEKEEIMELWSGITLKDADHFQFYVAGLGMRAREEWRSAIHPRHASLHFLWLGSSPSATPSPKKNCANRVTRDRHRGTTSSVADCIIQLLPQLNDLYYKDGSSFCKSPTDKHITDARQTYYHDEKNILCQTETVPRPTRRHSLSMPTEHSR